VVQSLAIFDFSPNFSQLSCNVLDWNRLSV
jgi:hypothetical protein